MTEITFRRAEPADREAVEALLTAAGLPLAGVAEHLGGFLLAYRGADLVGTAAVERYGEAGLLRSVAVAGQERGTGLGQEIVLRTLEEAHRDGIRQMVLLTTTADRFFPRFGFERVGADQVPAAVKASVEFQGVCPASAVIMMLGLDRPPVLVRPATEADVAAITYIYNQGIADKATLETEARTEAERLGWLQGRQERHPVVVAVQRGEVRGWASINSFNPREAYRFVGDLSVYVERSCRGAGLGTALMRDLMDRARTLGYHKLVLTTFPELTGAVRLYEKLGFRHVGDYREQGMLDGRWMDTRIMEYLL